MSGNKIKEFNAESAVFDWNKTDRQISKELEDKFGIKITYETIRTFKLKVFEDLKKLLSENEDFMNEIKEYELNNLNNLFEVVTTLKSYIDDFKKGGLEDVKLKDLNALLTNYLKAIDLNMKRLGEYRVVKETKNIDIQVKISEAVTDMIFNRAVDTIDDKFVMIEAPELVNEVKKKCQKKILEEQSV